MSNCKFGKVETDIEIKSGAERFYDVFLNRLHQIPSMISPQSREKLPSVEVHGDDQYCAKIGTLSSWHYVQDGNAKVAKEIIGSHRQGEQLRHLVIGGDLLECYKSFKFNLHITTPKPEGDDQNYNSNSSVVHWILEYEKVHEDVPEPHGMIQLVLEINKDLDAHLVIHTQSAA